MITTGGFRYDIMPPLGRILAGTGFLGLTCRLPQTYREGMVEFGILGPLEITAGGQPLPVQGARTRAVLAMLLVHAGQVVPAGRLVTRPPGYLIQVAPGELDAPRFERLARDGETALAAGDGALAARRLDEALGLWRGPALADVDDAPFARAAATRLEEKRLAALESRAEALLACGRHRELIGELETLTAAHPLRERLWSHPMLALYRAVRPGRRGGPGRAAHRGCGRGHAPPAWPARTRRAGPWRAGSGWPPARAPSCGCCG
jgi:hypothetical protein